MDSLNEYILQFIEQQRCHRHHGERAKMIKLKCNFKEAFICSQCIELDNSTQMITIKRATDQLSNFILFNTNKVPNQIQELRDKLSQFNNMFNTILQSLEKQIIDREQLMQAQSKQFFNKINELERLMRQITTVNQQKQADLQQQVQITETFKGSILLLLQNEDILYNCSQKEANIFNEQLNTKYEQINSMLLDVISQLQNLMNEQHKQPKSRKMSQTSEQFSPTHKHLFFSTFTSQLSRSLLQTFGFKQVHKDFKLLTTTKLNIPATSANTRKTRLALIYPRLQEGPLKPPKSITFFIQSQILQNLQIGVCETGSVDFDDSKPHKLFMASKYPYFNRGDQLTLTVNPATGFIQLVKNQAFNQPIQAELQLDCWTNMVFVVASQDCSGAGGEIHIIYDE